jgi:hypothetical protein
VEYTTLGRSIRAPTSSTPRTYTARAKGRRCWATPDRGKTVTGRFWRRKFTRDGPGNPNAQGLSRTAIEQLLNFSLDRLGMSSVDHVEAAVEAVDAELDDSEIDYLEEPYRVREIEGHERGQGTSSNPERDVSSDHKWQGMIKSFDYQLQ